MNPVDNLAQFSTHLQLQYGEGMLFIFWLIFTFLFLALIFLALTVLSRIAKLADERFERQLAALYEPFLLKLLYETDDFIEKPEIPVEIATRMRTRFQKQVFTSLIVRLNKGLDGELSLKLRTLYRVLQLDAFSASKLHAMVWHTQASGIDELREMRVVESADSIRRLLNHPNWLVRSNAQLAVLELGNPENRLGLFESISFPLTEWEQLRLHESLKSRNEYKITSFSSLFDSKNESIAIFGIRMSSYFGCIDDIHDLQLLSTDSRVQIRLEAILGLMRLGDFQMQEILADQFDVEPFDVQVAIMQYLLHTGYDRIAFYVAILNHPNHAIALLAAKALALFDPDNFPKAYEPYSKNMPGISAMLAHAADRRLQRL